MRRSWRAGADDVKARRSVRYRSRALRKCENEREPTLRTVWTARSRLTLSASAADRPRSDSSAFWNDASSSSASEMGALARMRRRKAEAAA